MVVNYAMRTLTNQPKVETAATKPSCPPLPATSTPNPAPASAPSTGLESSDLTARMHSELTHRLPVFRKLIADTQKALDAQNIADACRSLSALHQLTCSDGMLICAIDPLG